MNEIFENLAPLLPTPVKERDLEGIPYAKKIRIEKRNRKRSENEVLDAVKYNSPKEILGIDNWLYPNTFKPNYSGLNPTNYVVASALDHFGTHPSLITIGYLNIFGLFKYLKESGELLGVFSDSHGGNNLTTICALFKFEDSEIFVFTDNIKYLRGPKALKHAKKEDLVNKSLCHGPIQIIFSPNNLKAYDFANTIANKFTLNFEEEESFVDMIIATQHGLSLKSISLNQVPNFDLKLHYGENFKSYHDKLLSRIESKDKGIIMFHGPPGTGKTHYIRNLIPQLLDMGKRVILIPKHVLSNLESPQFNSFMLENFIDQKIVFIIEDAESIIAKRISGEGFRSELVSTLLNVTDGILNDIFNIQVILTFNTEISSIDEALLRKGRLISKYEFGNLQKSDAQKLADNLGLTLHGNQKSYSLAEIYAMREIEEDEVLINQNIPSQKSFVGF